MNIHSPNIIDAARWTVAPIAPAGVKVPKARSPSPIPPTAIQSLPWAAAARVTCRARQSWRGPPRRAGPKPCRPKRARILNRAADLLEQHGAELAGWIMRETGSIHPKAMIEIEHGALFIRHAATLATQPMGMFLPGMDDRTNYARRVPHGVVGVISPFNFPLVLSVRSIAAAIALGNTVVHKPIRARRSRAGSSSPASSRKLACPKAVLHILPGGSEAGEAICSDPNIAMVSFTGSARGGAKVGEVCGRHLKRVQLELGGKNALVILDDADLDIAASNAAWRLPASGPDLHGHGPYSRRRED